MVIIHMNEVPRLRSREDLTFHPGACLKSWSPSRFTRTSLGVTFLIFLGFTFFLKWRNQKPWFRKLWLPQSKVNTTKHFGFHWVFLDMQKHNGFRCKTPATVACKAPRTANQVLPVTVAISCPQREQPRIPPGLKPKLLDWGRGAHAAGAMYQEWFHWTILAEDIHRTSKRNLILSPSNINIIHQTS